MRNPENQYSFEATHDTDQVRNMAISSTEDVRTVNLAGRLMAIRDQGRIAFGDLHDQVGSIQVIAEDGITPEFRNFTGHSVGDWVGLTGRPGISKTGAASLYLDDWVTLAKTKIPFPNTYSGILNPEIRSRQRYLDLATNPKSLERFKQRSKVVSFVRKFLEDQDFIEVETPILQNLHGGATARPFTTHHNALNIELYLRIAPELYLKRLIVGGLTRVFEIGKNFRNEGISQKHNPEFTMLEAYVAYWDGEMQMQLTEKLVSEAAQEIRGSTAIEINGRVVDLKPPWPRVTMDSLVSQAVGRDISLSSKYEELADIAREYGIEVKSNYGSGKLILELYEKLVEDNLWGPVFVTEYPAEVSPLARDHRSRPGYTERFEGIVAGNELCNGFSELNDPQIQYKRFKDQEKASEYDEESMPMDHDYVRALMYGMPPTAGLGIGIDRLAMLITGTTSIRDVILFPTMKPDNLKISY